MSNKIQLSDRFGYGRLLRFTAPSILMMIFTSIYGVVDGFFVSNYVGKTAFAAVNFIMPFLIIVGALGFMFGTGGSAYVAKTMGEGKMAKANMTFSLITYATIITGVIIAILSIIFIRPVAIWLGATDEMLADCVLYGRINLIALPMLMVQYAFSSLVVTAEKPSLGLIVTIFAGVTNIVGDALFIIVFGWGVAGAAAATALGQIIGGVIPLVYFSCSKTSKLRLGPTRYNGSILASICVNGSSELTSTASTSIVSMLYNWQLMKHAGPDGVATYGTLMYVSFTFLAIFIGYSTGVAPVISYHYGAGNHDELKSLLRKSATLITICSVCMFGISEAFAGSISRMFVGYDPELTNMTVRAFFIYAFSFLFAGFAIFGSGFFTALNDGITSAIISFMRAFVLQGAAVLALPLIMGLDGIWCATVVAELLAVIIALWFVYLHRKRYKYL